MLDVELVGPHYICISKETHLFSTDLSEEVIRECAQVVQKLGYQHKGKFFCASITDLPFPDSSFQTIYSFDVLEHVADIDGGLSELNRVLDGGKLILTIPNKFGICSIIRDYAINHY